MRKIVPISVKSAWRNIRLFISTYVVMTFAPTKYALTLDLSDTTQFFRAFRLFTYAISLQVLINKIWIITSEHQEYLLSASDLGMFIRTISRLILISLTMYILARYVFKLSSMPYQGALQLVLLWSVQLMITLNLFVTPISNLMGTIGDHEPQYSLLLLVGLALEFHAYFNIPTRWINTAMGLTKMKAFLLLLGSYSPVWVFVIFEKEFDQWLYDTLGTLKSI